MKHEAMSGCGDDIICTDEQLNLSINENAVASWVLILIYLVVRFVQHLLGTFYWQANRELLRVSQKRRFEVSSCCPLAGVHKQAVLQFCRSICHVVTFVLILQKNWIMFGLLIVLDVIFVYIQFWIQNKDKDYNLKYVSGESDTSDEKKLFMVHYNRLRL